VKQTFAILILVIITLQWSCKNPNTDTASTQTAEPTSAAVTPSAGAGTPNNPNPLDKVGAVLQNCTKVEYMLYNFGISFESSSSQEVMSFYNYIENIRPDESQCKPETYDCGVVFKDAKGDIKQAMEVNIYPQCNRVQIVVDGKTYFCKLKQGGLAFFQQVINNFHTTSK
jgi:hypothetical protein